MGCNVYVFRKDAGSESSDHGEIFWDVKSWDLGHELSIVGGIGLHYQEMTADSIAELARDLIEQGKDDHCEYPDGALHTLLNKLSALDFGEMANSKWYLTLDF
jgi:hypothetical protein